MSFFYEFLDSIKIDELGDKVNCSIIFNHGVKILADFKIESLHKDEVVLKCKKSKIKIMGSDLEVVTIAKGEIEISGNVNGVVKVW